MCFEKAGTVQNQRVLALQGKWLQYMIKQR